MNIEFVSYSGEYPNLCSGKLVVKLDGKEVSFSPFTKKSPLIGPDEVAQYHKFWSPGGNVTFDEDWSECVTHGEWGLEDSYMDEYPDEIRDAIPELLRIFNENVPPGCCGGCV